MRQPPDILTAYSVYRRVKTSLNAERPCLYSRYDLLMAMQWILLIRAALDFRPLARESPYMIYFDFRVYCSRAHDLILIIDMMRIRATFGSWFDANI